MRECDRFLRSPALPKPWIECMVKAKAWELPKDVIVNSNGADDAFTAGFLVSALLLKPSVVSSSSNTFKAVSPSQRKHAQKMTAYTLYLSENYASLKSQCNVDKKEIFRRSHEQWQQETDAVRRVYEDRLVQLLEDSDFTTKTGEIFSRVGSVSVNAINHCDANNQQTLTLKEAANFASLVAAYHVNFSTRNLKQVDLKVLLEQVLLSDRETAEIRALQDE